MNPAQRLVVVSNRLPVVLKKERDIWHIRPGAGGLVTALASVLGHRGGVWVGWPGISPEEMPECQSLIQDGSELSGYQLVPVALTRQEIDRYYYGFSNAVLWPLFHDLTGHCDFNPAYWQSYLEVNHRFAQSACEYSRGDDFIWVHDYQLIHVAHFLRECGCEHTLGFFLHIPFPSIDIFLKLPWRAHILRALLAYDLLGFQTARDRRNFITCLRHLVPDVHISGKGSISLAQVGDRTVHIGSFPIGLDARGISKAVVSEAVEHRIADVRREIGHYTMILGVDRLDFTKGIIERLRAFRNALERYPDLRERVVFMQIVAPSREDAPEYQSLKARIERLVGEINGAYSTPGWVPVNYLYQMFSYSDLLALYHIAHVAFVTPLKDGMNLVAKEYCMCQQGGQGVLILSEFAGAASQLQSGALLVNPHDIEGMADALFKALRMGPDERRRRMQKMRSIIRKQDVFWWVDRYLRAAIGRPLDSFTGQEEYFPKIESGANKP